MGEGELLLDTLMTEVSKRPVRELRLHTPVPGLAPFLSTESPFTNATEPGHHLDECAGEATSPLEVPVEEKNPIAVGTRSTPSVLWVPRFRRITGAGDDASPTA